MSFRIEWSVVPPPMNLAIAVTTAVAVILICGSGCGDDASSRDGVRAPANDGAAADAGYGEQNNATANIHNEGSADAGSQDNASANNATSNNANATNNDASVLAAPYDDCALVVGPGESSAATSAALQEAFLDVQPGQVVCLVDGVYRVDVELSVDVADVEIRGQSQHGTILDFSRQQHGANGILATSDGFTIASLTLRDPAGDGIRTTGVTGATFREITVVWRGEPRSTNGAYGLYPVQSRDVLIERSEVRGARGAGIYVSQSQRIVVRDNELRGNVAGIAVANSTDAEIHDNDVHDNTAGLLVLNLPAPPIQGGERAKVHHNRVEDNDRDNFAAAGDPIAGLPPGIGVLVLAADHNELHDNTIRGNDSLGLGIASYHVLGLPWENPAFDPFAQGNYVHDNLFVDNGAAPEAVFLEVMRQAGLDRLEPMLWDGWVDPDADAALEGPLRNCFHDNVDLAGEPARFRMVNAPEGFTDQSTSMGAGACQGRTLDPVVLPQDA